MQSGNATEPYQVGPLFCMRIKVALKTDDRSRGEAAPAPVIAIAADAPAVEQQAAALLATWCGEAGAVRVRQHRVIITIRRCIPLLTPFRFIQNTPVETPNGSAEWQHGPRLGVAGCMPATATRRLCPS